ncbi:hypothetical protein NEUTE2DRAFT_170703, partial [Neurospora tetrasperma FGSC 2509]
KLEGQPPTPPKNLSVLLAYPAQALAPAFPIRLPSTQKINAQTRLPTLHT